MDPATIGAIARLWLLAKPIKTLRNLRERKRAERASKEDGLDWQPEEYTDDEVDAEMKVWLEAKAKGAVKSSTIGVAAVLVGLGGWFQANPEALGALVPDGYEGLALALVGVIVAVARLRTAGKS